MNPTTIADLRLRIAQRQDLCLGEHRLARAEDGDVSVYCDGQLLETSPRFPFPPRAYDVERWVEALMRAHDREVSRVVIVQLLDEVDPR